MKILQGLEIVFGSLFFIAVCSYMYFVDMPLEEAVAARHEIANWSYWNNPFPFILILVALVFALSSIFHAFVKSYVALATVLILTALISLGIFIGLATGTSFQGYPWIGISPGIFSVATSLLAIATAIISLKPDKSFK